jgi:simple sugar transport system permease protein
VAAPAASASTSAAPDERLRSVGPWRRLLGRPESGALSGAVLVFLLFAFAAGGSGMFSAEGIVNWGTVAAFLGVIAVGAALLMVAGEFDLSIGSMIGFAGMMLAIPASTGAGRCGSRRCSRSASPARSARSTAGWW